MHDWIPTTQQVRDGYRYDPEDDYRNPLHAGANAERAGRDFDRWLEQVKAEVRDDTLARQLPTRDMIAGAIYDVLSSQYGDFGYPTDAADAVLDLLKGKKE